MLLQHAATCNAHPQSRTDPFPGTADILDLKNKQSYESNAKKKATTIQSMYTYANTYA